MFGADLLAFFGCSGNQSPSGQMIGFTKEPSRALMDGSNSLFAKNRMVESCEAEVMGEVILHALAVHSFQMASGDYSGRKRQGCSPIELIEEIILSCQENGEDGFRVSFELGEGMKLGKDFQS